MEDIRIGLFGLFIANTVLALLFGTFPLVAGLLSGNRKYAFLGFVLSLAGGALLGIFLSFPLSLLFLWLILRDRSDRVADGSVSSAEAESL